MSLVIARQPQPVRLLASTVGPLCHGKAGGLLRRESERSPMPTEIVVRRRTLFGDDPLGIDDANL